MSNFSNSSLLRKSQNSKVPHEEGYCYIDFYVFSKYNF